MTGLSRPPGLIMHSWKMALEYGINYPAGKLEIEKLRTIPVLYELPPRCAKCGALKK